MLCTKWAHFKIDACYRSQNSWDGGMLKQLYSAIIESVLCSSITVWFGSATKTDIRRLQWTVRTAERIIGAPLPSLQDPYSSRVRKRAKKIPLDPSHPAHSLLELLPTKHWTSKQPDTWWDLFWVETVLLNHCMVFIGHRAAAQFQGLGNLLIAYAIFM